MVEIDKNRNSLDELLNAIIGIPDNDTQLTDTGSISESVLSGDSGDIKTNKIGFNSGQYLKTYLVFLSVSNGKRYEPVLYFVKKPYLNKEILEKQKPDFNSLSNLLSPFFSNIIDDYYARKSTEYTFEIAYIKKGEWVKDIMKFANIKEEEFSKWQDMLDTWCYKGNI